MATMWNDNLENMFQNMARPAMGNATGNVLSRPMPRKPLGTISEYPLQAARLKHKPLKKAKYEVVKVYEDPTPYCCGSYAINMEDLAKKIEPRLEKLGIRKDVRIPFPDAITPINLEDADDLLEMDTFSDCDDDDEMAMTSKVRQPAGRLARQKAFFNSPGLCQYPEDLRRDHNYREVYDLATTCGRSQLRKFRKILQARKNAIKTKPEWRDIVRVLANGLQSSYVDNVVCMGIGSFFGAQDKAKSIQWVWELALLMVVVDLVKEERRKDRRGNFFSCLEEDVEPELKIVFQDPLFCKLDLQLMAGVGGQVVPCGSIHHHIN